MPRSISLLTYKITLLLLFIFSMYPWFVWNISDIYFLFLGALLSSFFYLFNAKQFKVSRSKIVLSFCLFLVISWNVLHVNFNGAIGQYLLLIILIILINTNDIVKKELLKFITNWFGILVGISLFFYILFLIGVPLPQTPLTESIIGYKGINYYMFIHDTRLSEFYRFRSIFAEPGNLSMGLIPLIFANKICFFNLRNFCLISVKKKKEK